MWHDWGGFYDHVSPVPYPNVLIGKNGGTKYKSKWQCNYQNSWGCGYIYGFRVPFLVVSEYTGMQSNGNYTGYVSGTCGPVYGVTSNFGKYNLGTAFELTP